MIFDRMNDLTLFTKDWFNLFPNQHLLDNKPLHEYFQVDLPKNLEELTIKTYIGATDLYTTQLKLFSEGELIPPLLGSMALPGVFPSVKYQQFLLSDGGIISNFPVTFAKKQYPDHKVIGIVLHTLSENQEPKNLISILILAFEIMMEKNLAKDLKKVDLLFSDQIDCAVLELSKTKRKIAFDQGYLSGINQVRMLSST
jgi:NTE family protein